MEFLVEVDKKIYDVTKIITQVSYTDRLNDGCSKLEFSYINDDLIIKNGSVVRFKYNEVNIFYGYVFKVQSNKEKKISITAYDQLRYCKAKDTIVLKNDTAKTVVTKMCNYFSLAPGALTDTVYRLPTSIQDDKTWIDIVYNALKDTLVARGKQYALRDEFGRIALRDLEDLKLDLILGDASLVYGYEYTKSIDEDFYNQIKIVSDNEKTGKRDTYISKDSKSINSYGLLQYFDVLDKNYNAAQAKTMVDSLLKLYNRELETMSIECLGDTSVRAGNSFYGLISDIKLNRRLIVDTVTHEFLPNHMMSFEVKI